MKIKRARLIYSKLQTENRIFPVLSDSNSLKWLVGNTEGWANFLACLKAWMEYKVNLRKGAFDFMI